jgi:hypothetical protein
VVTVGGFRHEYRGVGMGKRTGHVRLGGLPVFPLVRRGYAADAGGFAPQTKARMFFFEKKNQKTLGTLGFAWRLANMQRPRVFCFFFSKKKIFPCFTLP